MKFAYADPPYIGQAKRLYGRHKDYAGEVDHGELIERMERDYGGWALSLSVKSLPTILALCPPDVLTLAWVKPVQPPMGDGRMYSWEPVILHGGRKPSLPTRMSLVCNQPQYTFRPKPPGHVIGQKPEEFCHWVFRCAGLGPDDELCDLFPGSGAVGRAWDSFIAQGVLNLV